MTAFTQAEGHVSQSQERPRRLAIAGDNEAGSMPRRTRAAFATLWTAEPLLTATGLFLLALLIPAAIGLWFDPRVISGAPAWLKPAKFAISTAIYVLTLAWVFTYLTAWPRTRRVVGRTTALVLLGELAIINLQAWRGSASHFNVSTPFDAILFAVMGVGIFVQTAASIAVAVALWRQRFTDRALGWALRLGMTLTIIGAATGGLMTRPTSAQLIEVRATGRMPIAGAHTVGAPDGGPGLPVTGWSTRHGDVRVPHFVGLHALQVLPLLTLLFFGRKTETVRVRFTLSLAAVYAAVFVTLLLQAMRGLPLLAIG
jgi:hypothetical protein